MATCRFLLLNFEDFGLNQDITKTIQPYNPFCICCLDREGPMFNLDKCEHSDYLDAFDQPQLKNFNQLVCVQCHNTLQKIKCFQSQILETYDILLSGSFTNTSVNKKRINSLIIQKVVDNIRLPPDIEITPNDSTNGENITNLEQDDFIEMHSDENVTCLIPTEETDENVTCLIPTEESIIRDNGLNIEENKNIKTALDILERNNQSFVTLSSQLQFLNGEHLSFLEPSLLSKEILTDIPLVPAKTSIDLDSGCGLINSSNSLEIEIDEPDTKMFYDSLDLSPDLLEKDASMSEIMKIDMNSPTHDEIKPKKETEVIKPKKERRAVRKIHPPIKPVKLSQEELNKERVMYAQSNSYLKYKFRCETCILGFNYEENLKDHNKRKHGPKEGDNIICNICYQVVPTLGSLTEHNYRHYTRYECVTCGKRYKIQNDALRHSAKKTCVNTAVLYKTAMKMKQLSQQLKNSKSKRKRAKNEP